jgi:hypothetical protein
MKTFRNLIEETFVVETANVLVAKYMNKNGNNILYYEIWKKLPSGSFYSTISNQHGVNIAASAIDLKSSHTDAKKNVDRTLQYYDQDGDEGALKHLNHLLPGWKKAKLQESVDLESSFTYGESTDTHKTKDGRTAKKGLWYNIHQRRKKGLPPKKPGDEDYPKTLNIGEETFFTESTLDDLENHISTLSKDLKLTKPVGKNNQFKSITYNTDMSNQQIFDVLKSKGYYTMRGYDPKTWNIVRNHEDMSFITDNVFYKDKSNLFMVRLSGEHGSKTKIIFSIK